MRKAALLGLLVFLLSSCISAPQLAPTPAAVVPTPNPTAAATRTLLPQPTSTPTTTAASPLAPTSVMNASLPGPATQDSLGDPYYADLGNGGYNALHYTLDLATDVERNAITATVMIEARATQDLPVFNLDFQGFTIQTIAINGQPATYIRSTHELTITPAEPLHSGTAFTTTIAYSGTPQPTIPEAIPIMIGWNAFKGGTYVASEPTGAATWYPVNDHPRDKALYTFRITVAKPLVAAANGLLQEIIDNGQTRTYVWETSHPMASYLATVDIAAFDTETAVGPNRLPIRNFFPADVARNATQVFSRTSEMIAYFSQQFGPYPFEAYGVVVADQDLGYALETQTLSLFGRDVASAPPLAVQSEVAHELAHQWFGDSVSVANWQDIWLNEGFASFAELLWLEHTEGAQARDDRVRRIYQLLARSSAPPPAKPPADDLFNNGVYLRGGLTLYALRLRLGDDLFFRMLRTYIEQYQYGNASTADFIAVAERVSQQDLKAFFNGWLYADDLPDLPELGLSQKQSR